MIFYKILSFILKAQAKQLFVFRNTLTLVAKGLFAGLVLLYAVGCGYILSHAAMLQINPHHFLTGVNITIAALTFVKSYFPVYQSVNQPIASFYPVLRMQKAIIGIAIDLLSLYPIGIALFYCIMFMTGYSGLLFAQIIQSFIFFITALFFDRSLRIILEYSISHRFMVSLGIILGVTLLFVSGGLSSENELFSILVQMFLLLVSIGSHMYLALQIIQPQIIKSPKMYQLFNQSRSSFDSLMMYNLKSFFTSNHVIKLFAMALLLKILMLFFLLKVNNQGISEINNIMHINMVWLYAMPIAWFTYFLNNSFGMNWQVWQTYSIHKPHFYNTLMAYLQYSMGPIILDALLSGITLWFRGFLDIDVIVFWICCTLALLAFGFISSIISPIKVEKLSPSSFLTLRQISSVSGRLGVIVIIVGIFLLSAIQYFLGWLIPLITFMAVGYILSTHKSIKYRIYHGIHE